MADMTTNQQPDASLGAHDARNARKMRTGLVVSDKMQKTVVVAIERRVDQGSAAAVLVEESRGADLLVVGSRGHGGFAQLLLGSVSQQCAQHAFCPVVIVRGTAKNGHEGVS